MGAMTRGLLLVSVLGCLLTACGDELRDDADADDGIRPPESCPLPADRVFVLDRLEAIGEGMSIPIGRDEADLYDHAFAPLSKLFNALNAQSIYAKTAIYMIALTQRNGAGDRGPVDLDFYSGSEDDGQLYVADDQFALDGTPVGRFAVAIQSGRTIKAIDPDWRVIFALLGEVPIEKAHLTMTLTDNERAIERGIGRGVLTYCGMRSLNAPGGAPDSFLEWAVVSGLLADRGATPDHDPDGDGLETVREDEDGVPACFDGDGTRLEVAVPDCVCDPRMVDGYSINVALTGKQANVAGVSGECPW